MAGDADVTPGASHGLLQRRMGLLEGIALVQVIPMSTSAAFRSTYRHGRFTINPMPASTAITITRSSHLAIGVLISLGFLAGCASPNLYKGLALPTCSGPNSAAGFGSGACRSGAEYDTVRKKLRHIEESKPADEPSDLEEIVPLDPRYQTESP